MPSNPARARFDAALAAGDPDGEVDIAWWARQTAQPGLRHQNLAPAERTPTRTSTPCSTAWYPKSPASALAVWRGEYLAYFDTGRPSNGPTDAVNLLVEKIRRVAHGYRRFDH